MGMSISAMVAYSIAAFDVGYEPWMNEECEEVMPAEDWLMLHSGEELPQTPPQPANWKDKDADDVKAWFSYWAARREIRSRLGVRLEFEGTEHWAEWHLIADVDVKACGVIDPAALSAVESEAHAKLAAFCARAG
jgi:hypothetical protein